MSATAATTAETERAPSELPLQAEESEDDLSSSSYDDSDEDSDSNAIYTEETDSDFPEFDS